MLVTFQISRFACRTRSGSTVWLGTKTPRSFARWKHIHHPTASGGLSTTPRRWWTYLKHDTKTQHVTPKAFSPTDPSTKWTMEPFFAGPAILQDNKRTLAYFISFLSVRLHPHICTFYQLNIDIQILYQQFLGAINFWQMKIPCCSESNKVQAFIFYENNKIPHM